MSVPLADLDRFAERVHVAERCVRAAVADTITFSNVDGPGNRFVVFLQGCNFDCIACHNPQTIPGHGELAETAAQRMSVDDVLAQIRRAAPFISGVTVSGGEATLQASFVFALFTAIKSNPALHHLTCLIDSNGNCPTATWDALAPVVDGVMVDLKALDPHVHLALTGQANDRVLASIRHLQGCGRLHEVRLLLVPGYNDDPEQVRQTARWLARIDPTMRVKLIGVRTHGTRPHDPPLHAADPATVARSADMLRAAGLDVHVVSDTT
jgi:pyruvate-formate lyase-activating enzyme